MNCLTDLPQIFIGELFIPTGMFSRKSWVSKLVMYISIRCFFQDVFYINWLMLSPKDVLFVGLHRETLNRNKKVEPVHPLIIL